MPSTAVYSRWDGVVDWRACRQEPGPQSENVAVWSSHLGMGHDPAVLWVVADRLAQPPGRLASFRAADPLRPRLSLPGRGLSDRAGHGDVVDEPRGACRACRPAGGRAADLQRSDQRGEQVDVAALLPMVRRIVAARVQDGPTAEDLVQETLVRVLAAAPRIERGCSSPTRSSRRATSSPRCGGSATGTGATGTASSTCSAETHDEGLVAREEQSAVVQALARLSERERDTLLAHEVSGQGTRSLADELSSAPPAPSPRS